MFQFPMSTIKLCRRSVLPDVITAVMLTEYSDVRDCIVMLTELPFVLKLLSTIPVTHAEVLIFFV